MSNTKIISKSPGTMDVEYYDYDSPLDRIIDIKDAYDPGVDEAIQNEIKIYSQDGFEARLKDRWKEFNLKEFAKKIGPILDKADEENQRCNKQIQEAIAKLKETTLGKLYLEEMTKNGENHADNT